MARKRGLGQCSICLCDNKGLRGLSLLSCSHVFHSTCLLSFERFSRSRKVGQYLSSLITSDSNHSSDLQYRYIFSFIYSCVFLVTRSIATLGLPRVSRGLLRLPHLHQL